ncbi:hypothetical protein PoB_001994000 [Plakobranchus ocellatus]|uniref:Uncharacterized protein n=1 Tax=Plakobranchus ocellatus TaxID=259542 RepID=A0AAV3ZE72_9GAST|nr:hypothetical protein PoB_001994000 [Plakobranchus ocellatus]
MSTFPTHSVRPRTFIVDSLASDPRFSRAVVDNIPVSDSTLPGAPPSLIFIRHTPLEFRLNPYWGFFIPSSALGTLFWSLGSTLPGVLPSPHLHKAHSSGVLPVDLATSDRSLPGVFTIDPPDSYQKLPRVFTVDSPASDPNLSRATTVNPPASDPSLPGAAIVDPPGSDPPLLGVASILLLQQNTAILECSKCDFNLI